MLLLISRTIPGLHKKFHVSLVEPYGESAAISDRQERAAIVKAPDGSSRISRILSSRRRGRGVQYLVLRESS